MVNDLEPALYARRTAAADGLIQHNGRGGQYPSICVGSSGPVTRLKGMLPRPERPVSLEEMEAEIRAVGERE